MYNAQKIAAEAIGQVQHHLYWKYLQALYFAPELVYDVSRAPLPQEQSPLLEQIMLLCRIANGEIARASADDALTGELHEVIQSVAETLWSLPLANAYEIPAQFWATELGQVMMRCQLWLRGDDLITISQAAELALGANTQNNRMIVQRAVTSGALTRYVDPDEPNPTRATRISRHEVEMWHGG